MFTDAFKVKVVGENGQVVSQNPNKPEYGSIRVEQLVFKYQRGFIGKKNRVSFIAGRLDELNELAELSQLKVGSTLPGNLYVKESFTPFYEGQQAKLNPSNGRACLVDGAMVYSQTFYDASGEKPDEYVTGDVYSEGEVIKDPTTIKIPGTLLSMKLSTGSGDNGESA